MRKVIITVLLIFSAVACKRDEIPLRGTVTIENTLFGEGPYYAKGFHFETASIRPTNKTPRPDITLLAETDAGGNITAVSFNGIPGYLYLPFSLYGSYGAENEAITVFNTLLSADIPGLSWVEVGKPLQANQIWLFKTDSEKYAKIRIVEVITEKRDGIAWASCRFQWVFQPDGSLTFPY